MNFANAILAVLALLSLVLALWQWFAARRFPLHRRAADLSFSPAITLLKPLKGCDETTAESLRSWFNQNYTGRTQILFGVADANDPVCHIVRDLIAENPGHDAQLVVCGPLSGANAKVAKLVQLEKLARHDLILVSDADVRVPPDLLANLVAPLRDPRTGLVNCFYRLANPTTLAMQWEAVAINADFWSQVLQAASLKPLTFALGAVMLTRRQLLPEIGGFNALADCLADDYQLGHRIAKNGHRISLCPVVVECWVSPMNWSEVWKHQLRWARTIRVCQPLPYFFSILSNATFWPLFWLAVSLMSSVTLCAPLAAASCLLIRICLAQNLQRQFMPSRDKLAPPWLVPVKDMLQAAIWLGAFTGSTVEWRGRRMKLRGDGTLVAT
ncbi:MAG: bacteriohopanetetrol glucosamine biosynthesis glycosyltransferase HpnI [Verrucomicrobiota bacterium]